MTEDLCPLIIVRHEVDRRAALVAFAGMNPHVRIAGTALMGLRCSQVMVLGMNGIAVDVGRDGVERLLADLRCRIVLQDGKQADDLLFLF